MSLIPRSLLGRSALLIAALIIVSQLITTLLFMYVVQRPRVLLMSNMAESHLQSIRVALTLIPEEKRKNYLDQLSINNSLHLQAESPITSVNAEAPSFAIQKFLQNFEKKLKPHEQIIYQSQPVQAVWVKILVDQQPYWVMFEAKQFNLSLGSHWLEISILMGILALGGGYIIHRALNQPLQHLSQVIKLIGKGQRVEKIEESGPDEVVAFIRTLNRMNSDLKKIEDDRAMMLAGISHDLRTPITRIQLALEMIGGDFDQTLKQRVQANLSEIENGLTQCLDFARNIDDEVTKTIDLNDLARLCAQTYKMHGYPVALDLCEDAQVVARPFALERMLKNLLDNAIKYANKDICISTKREGGFLQISVLDRGTSISSADMERLRRPFARGDVARGGATGFGLGLAIVDKIVQSHRARILYIEREGGGLEVRVNFLKPT